MKAPLLPPDCLPTVAGQRKTVIGVLVVAASAAVTLPAAAQTSAFSGEFSVQRFNPAPGPRNFITTRTVRSDGKMAFSGGLMANWGWEPLVVRSCVSETDCSSPNSISQSDIKVVENIVSADFMGSLTVIPPLQLGLRLPLTYVKGHGLTDQGRAARNRLSGAGLGDAELEGKYRFLGGVDAPLAAGGALFVTAPLGTATASGKYIGDSLPTVGLRAIADYGVGPWRVGANLIGVFRDQGRIGTTKVGSEMRYGVAGAYQISPLMQVILDAFGSSGFRSTNGTNALELDAALRMTPIASPLVITGGLGTGLINGVGVPKIRVFLGAMYVHEARDRDNDGIMDNQDQCPTEAEDRDGFEDSDGCPDKDNDADTIGDSIDKCPDQGEDLDGFEDADGCPDPDNDKDGVADEKDRCPDKLETKNGYKDDDGCPDEPDKDNDGVPDARDKCPDQPEDTDGFEDTDGCPDPDNDNDGIPDNKDECIDEPETVNGVDDQDGCPDEVPGDAKGKGKPPAGQKPPAPAAPPGAPPAAPAPPPADIDLG